MKYILFTLLLFSVLIMVSSCSSTQKIQALRPEPDDAKPLAFESETSFLSLPVSLKLKDIERQSNKLLTGLIYDDANIEDDNLTMQVWKQGIITISNENGKISTVLPLKVAAKYRYGTSKLGIDLYDTREFNLNGVVTLVSDVGLTNWQIKTNTSLKSLDWTESPSMTIAGKSIPITYLINPAIRLFKSKIEKSIDDAIKSTLDFKPQVLDALDQMATPIEMNADYESWFRLVPIELYTTEAVLNSNEIKMNMGLKCSMETFIGQIPEKKFDKNAIVLKPVSKMPDVFRANIVAVSRYSDASNVITKNFKGQVFESGSRKVTVQNVALWHKNGKMIIALDLTGSLNGTIYLNGFPQYNPTTKEIYFDDLQYVLETESTLIKSANWLAKGTILRKFQENCRYSIAPNMEEGKETIMKYLSNYSPMKGVYINGTLSAFDFEKIQLTNKAIIAYIKSTGQMDVKIDGLE